MLRTCSTISGNSQYNSFLNNNELVNAIPLPALWMFPIRLVFIVGDTFLCRPQQIQLKALIPPKYGSGTAILWNTGQTDSVILTTPTKDSTYSVHVNYFGCSGDKLHTVKVQNDSAKFTAGVVCLGDTTKFTNFSKVDTTDKTYTWAWDFGDGNTLNTASAVHVYTNGGTYNVTLTFTNPG
jgi:hypothetical protein